MTRLTLRGFVSAWLGRYRVRYAIDEISSDLPEEFYVPLSTAYSWLDLVRRWCLRLADALGLDPNGLASLWDLMRVPGNSVIAAIDGGFPRTLFPP